MCNNKDINKNKLTTFSLEEINNILTNPMEKITFKRYNYENVDINKLTTDLREEATKVVRAIGNYMGYPASIDTQKTEKIFTEISENPVAFARSLYSKYFVAFMAVKYRGGINKSSYKELCNELAIAVITILTIHIEIAKVMSISYSMNPNIDDPKVEKEINQIKLNNTECAVLLNDLMELDVNPSVKYKILNLLNTVNAIEKKFTPSAGCYIATYVYENYNSKEVLVLRQYRDKQMSNSVLGRLFIHVYYFISPILVKCMPDVWFIREGLKYVLNIIVKIIKKEQ